MAQIEDLQKKLYFDLTILHAWNKTIEPFVLLPKVQPDSNHII